MSKEPVDDGEHEPDVCVIELGGTIGDIESMPFVEALRQLQVRGRHRAAYPPRTSLILLISRHPRSCG